LTLVAGTCMCCFPYTYQPKSIMNLQQIEEKSRNETLITGIHTLDTNVYNTTTLKWTANF